MRFNRSFAVAAAVLAATFAAGAARANDCTWGMGYWGTHSAYGPSQYDATWAQIGEDTPFFNSGTTYYWAIILKPHRGNLYYKLSKQYVSATLNAMQGAPMPPTIVQAMFDSQQLFLEYTPNYNFRKDPRHVNGAFDDLAHLLRAYNSGRMGPHFCGDAQ
jgi:hypothetical protein